MMKLITGIFILFLVLIVIATDLGWKPLPVKLIYLVPGGDKISHLFLMGTLSFLVNITISAPKKRFISKEVLLGSLILLLIVTLEEFSQLFLKSREFSFIDLLSSYVGIVVFGFLAERFTYRIKQVS